MFEKVNPSHPDKIADRIAGALVDKAYALQKNPKIAVEVLVGHGKCTVISETSVKIPEKYVIDTVKRIAGEIEIEYREFPQDVYLAGNQKNEIRCGDNGVFRGVPASDEQNILASAARKIYAKYPFDGKYVYDIETGRLVICQSNAKNEDIMADYPDAEINPLGEWTGGTNVDTGATNRKLGSDMGDSMTGGGLHGKDLSKADVSVNIYAYLKAQKTG